MRHVRGPHGRKLWVDMKKVRAAAADPTLRKRLAAEHRRSTGKAGWEAHRDQVWLVVTKRRNLQRMLEFWGDRLSENERKVLEAHLRTRSFHLAAKMLRRSRASAYNAIREAASHLIVIANGRSPAGGHKRVVRRLNVRDADIYQEWVLDD